jgi:hypothetical protein
MTDRKRTLAELLIYVAGLIDRERPLLTMDDEKTPGVWVVRYPGREHPVFRIHEKDMPYMEWQNRWPMKVTAYSPRWGRSTVDRWIEEYQKIIERRRKDD